MRRRRLLHATAALALGGCASWTPPMGRSLLARCPGAACPPGLAAQARLDHVPFFAQHDTLCGPAVLASLLAWSGHPTPLDQLASEVYLPGRQGTLQTEMLAGARRHGALAVEMPARLDAVLAEVSAGTPVGVLVNLSLPLWPRWHYAVLLGHDLARGEVVLHSGEQAAAVWSLATFEHTWARSGHWAFVVLPPGRWPQQVDEAAALRALVGFDRATAAAADRALAWASARQRWPQRLSLAIGLAAAQDEAGQTDAAVATLEAATRQHDQAVAWNNLALAYARQGRHDAAWAAAERAVALAEQGEPRWVDEARRTRDGLRR